MPQSGVATCWTSAQRSVPCTGCHLVTLTFSPFFARSAFSFFLELFPSGSSQFLMHALFLEKESHLVVATLLLLQHAASEGGRAMNCPHPGTGLLVIISLASRCARAQRGEYHHRAAKREAVPGRRSHPEILHKIFLWLCKGAMRSSSLVGCVVQPDSHGAESRLRKHGVGTALSGGPQAVFGWRFAAKLLSVNDPFPETVDGLPRLLGIDVGRCGGLGGDIRGGSGPVKR
jgi:hypothetical protein